MYKIKMAEVKLTVDDLLRKYQNYEKFIEYCMKCPNYNTRWSCPPVDFDADEYLMRYKYSHIICTRIVFNKEVIIQTTKQSEIDKISNESISAVRKILLDNLLSLEAKFPDSISIVSGGCNLCEECTRENNQPCIHPDKMRYSLDTFGFDLTYLLKDLFDTELKWEKNRLPEYYTLVSAFLTNNLSDNILTGISR